MSNKKAVAARGLVAYVLQEVKLGGKDAKVVLTQHLRSDPADIEGIEQEFEFFASLRTHQRKDAVNFFHEVLGFGDQDRDHITPEVVAAMAQEYMRLRAPQCGVLASYHQDQDSPHVHFLIAGTQLDGKGSRVSQKEFADIKQELQVYQERHFPQLKHSSPEHGKKKRSLSTNREDELSRRSGKPSRKQELVKQIASIAATVTTTQELRDQLASSGITPYDRGGTFTGVIVEGRKYRLKTLGLGHILPELETRERERSTKTSKKEKISQNDAPELTQSIPSPNESEEPQIAPEVQEQESLETVAHDAVHTAPSQDEPTVHPPEESSTPPTNERSSSPPSQVVSSRVSQMRKLRNQSQGRDDHDGGDREDGRW